MLKISCTGSGTAPLSDLNINQGNLKDLTEENYKKLKAQILTHGFTVPFFVWDKQNGVPKQKDLLDGTQRKRTLEKMVEEGIETPSEFPIVSIDAPNEKNAKSIILAISSQYGRLNEQGLYEFMHDAKIDIGELKINFDFDAIDFEKFEKGFFLEESFSGKNKEVDLDELGDGGEYMIRCPQCSHTFPQRAGKI